MIKSYNRKVVGNMLFRKAETREAEAIRALYQAVIGTPFCTWDESYPGETEIAGDLSAGTLYVLEEDHQVIGAISIVPENELDHFNCWALKENAREFARISSTRDCPFIWLKALSGSFKDRELPQSILPSQKRISRRRSSIEKRASIFVGKPTCTGTVISCAKGPSKFVR